MINTPFISVVIPLYNKAEHIKRTIDCVLGQTFQNFELIIVDDGSTDGGGEVVKGMHDHRVKLISQKNMGRSTARNNGIANAISEYVALLDADDEWQPNHLETIVLLINQFPNAGAWGTAYDSVGITGKFNNGVFLGIPPSPWEGIIPRYFYSAAIGQDPLCANSVALSKKILHEIGMFPTDHSVGEDVFLWGKIALKYSIAFSWNGRTIYRQDAANRTNAKWNGHPFVDTLSEEISRDNIEESTKRDLIAYKCKLETLYAGNLILRGENRAGRKLLKKINVPTSLDYKTLKLNYYFWLFLSYCPKWFVERYAMRVRNLLMKMVSNRK